MFNPRQLRRGRHKSEVETGLTASTDPHMQEVHDELERLAQRVKALEDRPLVVEATAQEIPQARAERKKLGEHRHPYIRLWFAATESGLAEPVGEDDFGWTENDKVWWTRNITNTGWVRLMSNSDPEPVEGTSPSPGTSRELSRQGHQHGIPTTLTAKDNGTVAYYGQRGYMKASSTPVCITHIE